MTETRDRQAVEPSPSRPRRTGLSKSRITLFEQCPKRLWLSVHRPELAQEEQQVSASMTVGHDVGALACDLYPGGHMVASDRGLAAAAEETTALLREGWDGPIFEATFVHEDVLVRVDLLLPGPDGWHVAEVKSTTGVKAYHLADLATQLWVIQGSGVKVASAAIRHLDRGFVLREEGQYAGLFVDGIVNDLVAPLITTREDVVAGARATLAGDEPVAELGAHCDDPFTCSFKPYCGRSLPPAPEWPASLLPDAAGKRVARTWAQQQIHDLLLIPEDALPNDKLRRVYKATQSGVAYHDPEAIRAETAGWAYPRTYLDFETIQFAIPRWIGTRPYEQVPFQFSAHIEEPGGRTEHHYFLSTDGRDPRRACAEALAGLPSSGAVIAWNAGFERGCLLGLADLFADLAPALGSIADRLVDLLPVARRHYYHRDMRGSWSIKAVLPTLAPELGYEKLDDVRSGTDAQAAYLEAAAPKTPAHRREKLTADLLAYCERDTWAMKVVFDRLVGSPETKKPMEASSEPLPLLRASGADPDRPNPLQH